MSEGFREKYSLPQLTLKPEQILWSENLHIWTNPSITYGLWNIQQKHHLQGTPE